MEIVKKNSLAIILFVILYLISFGASYFLFSKTLAVPSTATSTPAGTTKMVGDKIVFNPDAPKTEACPLSGVLYSKDQKNWWEKHRPLGVMIENHQDARPQSGLSFADVVYEAVAEGAITRFLAVFYCQDAGEVGPVRSARTYFLDFISEYGEFPLYAHVGGANQPGPADALSQITDYGWTGYNDMNQFSIGFPTFWRDYDRLGHPAMTEHTMYSTTDKLWDFGKSRGLTNVDKKGKPWDEKFVPYSFKDDAPLTQRPLSQSIHVEHWQGYSQYFVDWNYDKTTNLYKRNTGGVAHIDRDVNAQLTTKNIVLLFMQETHAYDGYEDNAHLLYRDKGTGRAQIFMDGVKILGTWRKDLRTERTLLFDGNGAPIKFDRGTIWFEILPMDAVVNIK